MKCIKKLAAIALPGVLTLALLAGCGSNRPPAASQQPDNVPSNTSYGS